MKIMKLENETIIIRNFTYEDLDDLHEMCHDERTAYLAGWRPHKDIYITSNVLTRFIYANETYAIIYKENNKMIGTISLYSEHFRKVEGVRELGYCLNKDYRGKNIMTMAVKMILEFGFNKLKADMIFSCCQTTNFASRKVLEKNHLKYEGLIRNYRTLYNKDVVDVFMYSLAKKEFEVLENERIETKI